MIEYLVFPPVSHWVYKCITNFLSFQYEDIAVYAITLVISNQYSVQIYLHWKGVYNCFVILNMFHQHIHTIRFLAQSLQLLVLCQTHDLPHDFRKYHLCFYSLLCSKFLYYLLLIISFLIINYSRKSF